MSLLLFYKVTWFVVVAAYIFAVASPDQSTVEIAAIAAGASVLVGAMNLIVSIINNKAQREHLSAISVNVDGNLRKVMGEVSSLRDDKAALQVDKDFLRQQSTDAQRVIEDKAVGDAAVAESKKDIP